MTTEVGWVAPAAPVDEAARLMRDLNVGLLPVCDRPKHVVGAVTDRDLALRVCADDRRPSGVSVGEVMTPEVIALGPQDSVETAEEMMAVYKKARIFVLDHAGDLLGVVSLADVARAIPGERSAETLRRMSARPRQPGNPST